MRTKPLLLNAPAAAAQPYRALLHFMQLLACIAPFTALGRWAVVACGCCCCCWHRVVPAHVTLTGTCTQEWRRD